MPDDAPGRDARSLHSMEAEQAVLGGLLLSQSAYDRIVGMVALDDFDHGPHRLIFRAIEALVRAQRDADVLTVFETLRASGDDESAGGIAYLHQLAASTPTAANIKRYAEIVHDRALLRRIVATLSRVGCLATEANGLTGAQVLDQVQQALGEISTVGLVARGELRPISAFIAPTLCDLDEATQAYSKHGVVGTSTGFRLLDDRVGGLMPGQLVVIAGRPGMGKSAIALNIARHVAMVQRLAAGYFSMEMEGNELTTRLLADLANVHGLRLAHGRIPNDVWEDIGRVAPTLESAPIFLCQDGYLSITEVSAGARRMAREAKQRLGVIVIDYLGLMRTERQTSNRAQDLAEISRGLKALAKELKVPVLLLCQLNRECEKRGDKRPLLSDLRDSGEIEADADKVLMLYRDAIYHEYEDNDVNRYRAEVLIRKQRNGDTGKVMLRYDGARTRFSDWEPGVPA